jgi:hypothetical protein
MSESLTSKQATELVGSLPNADDVVRRYVADALVDEIERLNGMLDDMVRFTNAQVKDFERRLHENNEHIVELQKKLFRERRATVPPSDVQRDAARYRWLRDQHNANGELLCVMVDDDLIDDKAGIPTDDALDLDRAVDTLMCVAVTKPAAKERDCPNCDTAMPDGCKGTFKDEGPACWHNWWHLKPFGYAPGKYTLKCPHCKTHVFNVDKRASACLPCATALYESKQREAGETSAAKWKCSICDHENEAAVEHCDRCEYSRMVCVAGGLVPRTGQR